MTVFSMEFRKNSVDQRRSGGFFGKAAFPSFEERGQVIVEYLLMTVMLLFLFTGLYRLLQGQLATLFAKAGRAILVAYY